MPGPIKLDIELDLDSHLARFHGVDPETGHELSEPQTLEDIVLERAARIVAERTVNDAERYKTISGLAREKVTELIGDRVAHAVETAIKATRQPTDQWGKPTGDPVTFEEYIAAEVDRILKRLPQRDSFSSRNSAGGTLIEVAIENTVKEEVAKHVKEAVKAERDAIVARVTASTAEVLTEGLRRAATL